MYIRLVRLSIKVFTSFAHIARQARGLPFNWHFSSFIRCFTLFEKVLGIKYKGFRYLRVKN